MLGCYKVFYEDEYVSIEEARIFATEFSDGLNKNGLETVVIEDKTTEGRAFIYVAF